MVAPSSPFEASRLSAAIQWLENRGYRVKVPRGLYAKEGYLAGSDSHRQRLLADAFQNPNVQGVFCARGGYGAMRLDVSGVSHEPKVFMGFSDVTVLLNQRAKDGWVGIHGPVLASPTFLGIPPKRRGELFSYLESPKERVLMSERDFQVMLPGNAKGTLWGGNLSLVQSTLKTPLEIPFSNSILFLEETHEPPYRIDRMLTQLALAGVFEKITALVLGEFLTPKGQAHSKKWLEKLLSSLFQRRKIPVIHGLKAGHRKNEVWLPIGGEVELVKSGKRFVVSPLVKERVS